jgi:hypothetical protein
MDNRVEGGRIRKRRASVLPLNFVLILGTLQDAENPAENAASYGTVTSKTPPKPSFPT